MAIKYVIYIVLAICTTLEISSSSVSRDVVLLLDSSDDYRSKYFELEKQFAIDVIEGIYNQDTRIGVYTFGRKSHAQFNLDLYSDIDQMRYAINHMWYSTGNGNLEDAIDYTIDNAFNELSGNRGCVPNVLVILTHKAVTDPGRLAKIGEQLELNIIRVFVLQFASNASADFIPITGESSRVINVQGLANLNKKSSTTIHKIASDLPRSGCGQLTTWTAWSDCSSTCNFGQKFRTRDCAKENENDTDCTGLLFDGITCTVTSCAVDGGWSYWGSWAGCSKSCDTGIQNRFRTCTMPEPYSGGKPCEGVSTDSRNCNAWSCPDCSKTCPSGGHLSSDCQLCLCASITLFGRILDDNNATVEGANIYLGSRRNEPIASTDSYGKYHVDGICIMNEDIIVQGKRHVELRVLPLEVNITHWKMDAVIEKKVTPVFNLQPKNKIRMVGQSFSLCCSAIGYPPSTSYKWYKNGVELQNQGTNGSLIFKTASKGDSAIYKCSTETDAGVSQSTEAIVEIKVYSTDTCGPPSSKLKQLPAGCYVTGDDSKNDTLDVGTCEKSACMLSSLRDNGTCSDWWFYHCCDVKDIEMVSITCDGFTYQTSRVASCECHICMHKTTVYGRVTGRENNTIIPLQLGTIFVGNVEIGRTNMAGFFNFEAPKDLVRLVVTFRDTVFKKFLDVTKILEIIEGQENHATIEAPIKPEPVAFNSQTGTEFQLGTSEDNFPALGSIVIPENSLVDLDGQPFTGIANAVMYFVDPRDRNSLDTANGEFVSETEDGSFLPLETYGLFNLGVFDNTGQELQLNKKLGASFDTSVLNVALDDNGEPDLAIWDYDTNKGIWVENAKFNFEQNAEKGRKLLSKYIHTDIDFNSIKSIAIKEEVVVGQKPVVTGWTNMNKNLDKRRPIYTYVPVKEERVKQGVCHVSVSVYEDLSLKEPYSGSAKIILYTREPDLSKYLGKSDAVVKNGHACVVTFCDKLVYLSVKDSQNVNLYPGKHVLPYGYRIAENDREINFDSIDRGVSYRCPDPSMDCKGPMYQFRNLSDCRALDSKSKTHQFKFAPFTRPPSMSYTVGSDNIYDKMLSWYPVSPETITFRACFMKVLVKIKGAYDLRLLAKSLLHTFDGQEFGTHDLGPITSPNARNDEIRAACFEFRCPGFIRNGSQEIFDLSTAIEVHLTTKEQKNCSFRVLNNNLQGFTPIRNSKGDMGFRFHAVPGNNYGPFYGIYVYDKSSGDVEKICNSGTDSGVLLSGLMDPERNAAVEFNCL